MFAGKLTGRPCQNIVKQHPLGTTGIEMGMICSVKSEMLKWHLKQNILKTGGTHLNEVIENTKFIGGFTNTALKTASMWARLGVWI